jgi:hypothetical protein
MHILASVIQMINMLKENGSVHWTKISAVASYLSNITDGIKHGSSNNKQITFQGVGSFCNALQSVT